MNQNNKLKDAKTPLTLQIAIQTIIYIENMNICSFKTSFHYSFQTHIPKAIVLYEMQQGNCFWGFRPVLSI